MPLTKDIFRVSLVRQACFVTSLGMSGTEVCWLQMTAEDGSYKQRWKVFYSRQCTIQLRFEGTSVGFLDCRKEKSVLFKRRKALTERHSVTHSSHKTSTTPLSKPHMSHRTEIELEFNPQSVPDYRHTTATAVGTLRSGRARTAFHNILACSLISPRKETKKNRTEKAVPVLNTHIRTTQQHKHYHTPQLP